MYHRGPESRISHPLTPISSSTHGRQLMTLCILSEDDEKLETQQLWISGPVPLDSTALLHTRSRSPEVPDSIPCRPEVPTHLGVSSTPQSHKKDPAMGTASHRRRRQGLLCLCWFAAQHLIPNAKSVKSFAREGIRVYNWYQVRDVTLHSLGTDTKLLVPKTRLV